jgi:hypothetical protein
MGEEFTLSIPYQGNIREISCRLRTSAYTYQVLCKAGDSEWIVEKDDEGKMRAREMDPFTRTAQKADPGLVRALMEEMERILL